MAISSTYTSFLHDRQTLIDQTTDPRLKQHYQAEIDLIKSWDPGDIQDPPPLPGSDLHTRLPGEDDTLPPDWDTGGGGGGGQTFIKGPGTSNLYPNPPGTEPPPIDWSAGSGQEFTELPETSTTKPPPTGNAPGTDFSTVPHGYAKDWHTVRFSNTTDEALTVQITVASGQKLPPGTDSTGLFTIPPGGFVDLTFDPGTSFNFKSTKGDGSVWNQGELYFDEANHVIWGNMSYIYGANSNMRIFSQDGQHSGYLGPILAEAPPEARIGDWGIMAPFDRFNPSDDPNDPDSAAGGPDGAKNAGSAYLYSILEKAEGYVGRGRPVEVTDYDDASSLRFTGNMAVVF